MARIETGPIGGHHDERKDGRSILLTILVILHHLAIGYGAPGDNIYVEAGEISTVSTILMTLFVAINQAFSRAFSS